MGPEAGATSQSAADEASNGKQYRTENHVGKRGKQMGKITFMGAGSTVFAKNVLGDSMLTPALREFEIALYDIDAGDHALLRDVMSACVPNDLCHVARPQLPQEMIDPFAVIF